ncbi:MAG: tRNA (guanosine(37)-N1)-methyltransferase TrmD [Pseudomonadales bacterium]|jgi:tRNA (guanine37-N1)-methyltransferase|nr:tRNA (guanosine(37)-N1)-methyltransferase TrmD [Pseudomonadales bacterium]
MWLGVISLLPEMFDAVSNDGVFGRALASGRLTLNRYNPRDFTKDKHRTVDDRPYGGGPGMVMMVEPLRQALAAAKADAPADTKVVLMSPQGKRFDQGLALTEAASPGLILICGRYEGIDERFVSQYVDAEWSVGDYVLSGGELPAMTVMDAISRHLPGTLGNQRSVIDESHLDGTLDYPHYTRPEIVGTQSVPQELMSGDHNRTTRYRRSLALQRTMERRPDLLTGRLFDPLDRQLLTACAQQLGPHTVEKEREKK